MILKAQGASKVAELIVNDEELEEKLRKKCLDVANLPVKYR